MRLFTAIKIPPQTVREIERVQRLLQEHIPCRRWQPLHNLHLTVHFLGEVDESAVTPLQGHLDAVCRDHQPLRLELGHVGGFPSPNSPKVLWIGISGDRHRLEALEKALRGRLRMTGLLAENRPYSPHITLGREAVGPLRPRVITGDSAINPSGWLVDKICLFRSELRPSGAVHTVVSEHKLAPRSQEPRTSNH